MGMTRIAGIVAVGVVAAGIIGAAFAQVSTPERNGGQRSRLEFAAGSTDTELRPDGSFLKRYTGGVTARTPDRDAELKASAVDYDSRTGLARFYGEAAFRDSTRHLNADTLVFRESDDEVEAMGNVIATEIGRRFRADRAIYRRIQRWIGASGHVVVHDDSLRASLTGKAAAFNDSTGYGIVTGSPVLMREDERGVLLTISCADTLEVMKGERRARLWPEVRISQDSLTARADRALFDGSEDSLGVVILSGSPHAEQVMNDTDPDALSPLRALSEVDGDTITVRLRNRRVDSVAVTGGAAAVTAWTDTTGAVFARSVLQSNALDMAMIEGLIDRITAAGNAQSYYHRRPAGDETMFVNEADGDTIRFFFEKGRIRFLRIAGYGSTGARGNYFEYKPISPADSTAATPKPDSK